MNFDLRIPIGLMFGIYGVLLTAYGLFGEKETFKRSLDINIDLVWGVVLLIFGGLMLLLAMRGAKKPELEVKPAPVPVKR